VDRYENNNNGTNLVGEERELSAATREMNHSEIMEKLCKQQIDWKFNPLQQTT